MSKTGKSTAPGAKRPRNGGPMDKATALQLLESALSYMLEAGWGVNVQAMPDGTLFKIAGLTFTQSAQGVTEFYEVNDPVPVLVGEVSLDTSTGPDQAI